ncbi:ClC family H(+)/Cl(-) exchange transporter [Paenibacillus sp. sptzw28]|nr:ClC family H(+)/Cl(-) exchange transporter [Paenibacillus sp. sptzw28]
MNRNNTVNTLSSWINFKYKLIVQGMIIGLSTGLVVALYRFILAYSLNTVQSAYRWQLKHPAFIPVWFVVLAVGGWITGLIVKRHPIISGSGIPQVKGVLHSLIDMTWWKTIIGKCIGGAICIGAGLSLGREGPSIQIGAALGQGFSRIFKKVKTEENFMITCEASAGLSAAFNAPIAGVIFALEEMHANFSPLVMISALASSLAAGFISNVFFGLGPLFHFGDIASVPLYNYAFIIVLGALTGALGIVFNRALFMTQDLYQYQRWVPAAMRPVVPFLLAGVLGFTLPEVLGGGNELVDTLFAGSFTLTFLGILLLVKFMFTMISYGSSAPGGIFLPMLVAGALIGAIYFKLIHDVLGYRHVDMGAFILLAMAGYFTAVVKAPITGIILITEMTGSFSNLLPAGVVCFTAYIVVELFHSKPIYEELLERLLLKRGATIVSQRGVKMLLEFPVHMASELEGKRIKDFRWPAHCLIVGIKRADTELIPTGETFLRSGDYLVILTNEEAAANVRSTLTNITYHTTKTTFQ